MSKIARSTVYQINPMDLIIIGLDTETPDKDHPLWQKRATRTIPKEEIETAKVNGIADVILVTKDSDYGLVVVAGRQRVKALRKANAEGSKHTISYKLVKGTKAELMSLMIQENALRTDLTPLEKATDAQRLIQELESNGSSMTDAVKTASLAFGVSGQSIKDWLALTSMDKSVKKAVEKGQISAYNAVKTFRKVPVEKQAEKVEEIVKEQAARPVNPKTGKPKQKARKPKGHRDWVKFMANDEGSSLSEPHLLLLQFAIGDCTQAEVSRKVRGFKESLARAKRQTKDED